MNINDYNLINKDLNIKIEDLAQIRANMLMSFIYYLKVTFEMVNQRPFDIESPPGHESHVITIARELRRCFDGDINRLAINIPPRYGKTTLVIHFIAWGLCHSPDGNNLLISYGEELSTAMSTGVQKIITHPMHQKIFPELQLDPKKTSYSHFFTTAGGTVYSASAGGVITGFGAGLRNCNDRFGGVLFVDDIHKPNDVTHEASRNQVFDWYDNTLISRINSQRTPIIFNGQRLHEYDIFYKLFNTKDDRFKKNHVKLKALTDSGFALCPNIHSVEDLKLMEKDSPYTFYAQYQQEPLPAGGALFKASFFKEIDIPEDIISTFITADTAETSKTYNDATVFSFWGVYNKKIWGKDTDENALIWLDCVEIRVEPDELEQNFINFYRKCSNFYVKPAMIGIEEKSTGRTLLAFLKKNNNLMVLDPEDDIYGIKRTRASGSKSQRFIDIQSYLSKGYVTMPKNGEHNQMVIEHMKRITANNSHKHDDIADTCYDAIKLAIIDKVVIKSNNNNISNNKNVLNMYMAKYNSLKSIYARHRNAN